MKTKRFFSKSRKRRGFSLVEMLAALLIMALLAVMVSTSVSAAVRTYQRNIFASESEVLASTVNTAMSDILCYAKYVEKNASNQTVFINANYKILEGGVFFVENGYIYYLPYAGNPARKTLLVGIGSYTSLGIKDLEIAWTPDKPGANAGVFNVSYTIYSRILTGAEKKITCSFRSLVGGLADIKQ